MTEIYVDFEIANSKPASSLRAKLKKSFNPSSYRDLDTAVQLANYLVALGEFAEARLLLDSFIDGIEYDETREDLWGSNGQGIILRAYISEFLGDHVRQKDLLAKIDSEDIISSSETRFDYFSESKEEYEGNISYALDETQKHKCASLGQEALTFLYFDQMAKYSNDPHFDKESLEEIKRIVDDIYVLLRDSLI